MRLARRVSQDACDTYGSGKLKEIYYARSQEFAERFQQVYGRSLADAEADWLRYVAAFAG